LPEKKVGDVPRQSQHCRWTHLKGGKRNQSLQGGDDRGVQDKVRREGIIKAGDHFKK